MGTYIASEDRKSLSGLAERVTFHSPETGFYVLRLSYSRLMGENRAAQIARQSGQQKQPLDHLHWRAAV